MRSEQVMLEYNICWNRKWFLQTSRLSMMVLNWWLSWGARMGSVIPSIYRYKYNGYRLAWLDGAEVSASGWGSGGPRFQSHPRLTFQSCSRFQLNQLGSKAASETTLKKSNTCGVSNTRLYFTLANKLIGICSKTVANILTKIMLMCSKNM